MVYIINENKSGLKVMFNNKAITKFITILIIVSFLSENTAFARGNNVNSDYLAPESDAGEVVSEFEKNIKPDYTAIVPAPGHF
jgi:hypothetical protein